jgi:hypothetical protein
VELHHQRNARKALGLIEAECAASAESWRDEWNHLYTNLVDRHSVTGIATFSRDSFAQQLRVPGITAFRATQSRQTVGVNLWYVHQEEAGYYHLGAGAGAASDGSDGLTRFKRGWTNATRIAYLCGRIFDHPNYRRIAEAKGTGETHYFPAYRKGEFV